LDLLLYLVRKHELDLTHISIARITGQYLEYLSILERLDVDAVGDFLEVASLLIEMKSRILLPHDEEPEAQWEDPREGLVERLLEYKKYKDVASMLEERARQWQQTVPRLAHDLPRRRIDPAEQPLREIELWDLVSALGRVLRETDEDPDSSVIYDDIPIQVHMKTIFDRLCREGRIGITETLRAGMRKSVVIGLFLAVLELVRHHSVEAEQDEGNGEIWVVPGPNFGHTIELTAIDNYDADSAEQTRS
jgi:segregation and condensation protein A